MIFNVIQSIRIISDTCNNFTDFLVKDLQLNEKQIRAFLGTSLMLITALSPVIGYDKAAEVAHLAMGKEISLKEACIELGYVSADEFDRLVDPYKMAHPFS